MLKITEMSGNDSGRTLKLEGKLFGPWVDELRKICMQPLHRLEQIRLDLAALTFLDAAGAKLLHELTRQGVIITRCSGFVAELLQAEGR